MTDTSTTAIYSCFGDDPVLGELVEQYVSEMPDRIATLEEAFASGDLEAVRRTAHQMKGAAGSYGFDVITDYARTLEFAAKEGQDLEAVERSLRNLISLCRCVRAGAPSDE